MLALEIGIKFIDVIDHKFELLEFEKWLYCHETIQSELTSEEYLDLISFNYKCIKNHYKIRQYLLNLLEKYQTDYELDFSSRCIKGVCITNTGKYNFDDNDRIFNLTKGKIYNILSIHYSKLKDYSLKCQYIIIDDNEDIYYIPSTLIKIEMTELPDEWIIEDNGNGTLTLEPKRWNSYQGEMSFWEDFHNNEEHALEEFVKVLQNMNVKIPVKFRYIVIKLMYLNRI